MPSAGGLHLDDRGPGGDQGLRPSDPQRVAGHAALDPGLGGASLYDGPNGHGAQPAAGPTGLVEALEHIGPPVIPAVESHARTRATTVGPPMYWTAESAAEASAKPLRADDRPRRRRIRPDCRWRSL